MVKLCFPTSFIFTPIYAKHIIVLIQSFEIHLVRFSNLLFSNYFLHRGGFRDIDIKRRLSQICSHCEKTLNIILCA